MAPVIRVLGGVVGGLLVLLSFGDYVWRAVRTRELWRLSIVRRVALLIAGVLVIAGGQAIGQRLEAAFGETSVVVTAHPLVDPIFPIAFDIHNDFQTLTNVRVSCVVSRFTTDRVQLSDTEALNRTVLPSMAPGARQVFECPAPSDVPPPFELKEVRAVHVNVDVLFSTPDRFRRLGVRQGFDLVVGNDQTAAWRPVPPMLLR